MRRRLTTRLLRPGGSPWVRDQVVGRIPIVEGVTVTGAAASGDGLRVDLSDGTSREVDNVIVCVGYGFDLARLGFLDAGLRKGIAVTDGWPVLDRAFRTTDRGIQLVGYAAERRFGPLSRFVAGTPFAATRACSVL